MEYFEALAQIGPVLLLAFVLEERLGRGHTGFGMFLQVWGLLTTFAAEVIALAVVAGVLDASARFGLMTGGLFLISVAYLLYALGNAASRAGEQGYRVAVLNSYLGMALCFGGLAMGVGALFA